MEKQYEVTFSYTVDYVAWTCPQCDHYNESETSFDECIECKECGFTRDISTYEMGYTDAEVETFTYYGEED